MPYTLAHPAAAWPLWSATRGRLRLAALAIGAMMPDVLYFPRMNFVGGFGHSALGLILFCLPAGWLCLWLFDRFAVRGLNVLLPRAWRVPPARVERHPVLATSAALLLGAASHVFWDGFTHASGFVVTSLPALSVPIGIGPLRVRPYKLLQHASTVLGLAFLGVAAYRSRSWPPVPWPDVARRALWPAVVVGAVAVLNGLRVRTRGIEAFFAMAGVAATFAACSGILVLGAFARQPEGDVGSLERGDPGSPGGAGVDRPGQDAQRTSPDVRRGDGGAAPGGVSGA